MLNNKKWWKAALTRMAKTVAQTALATVGTTALLEKVNWLAVLSASALAGVLSLLTSLAGLPEVENRTPDEDIKIARPDGWQVSGLFQGTQGAKAAEECAEKDEEAVE